MNLPYLSIVMPALNEEKNILSVITNTLRAFNDFKISGEIIIINDGSRDRTQDIVKDLMLKEGGRIILLNHNVPHGIGASFWDGVDAARGEIVCLLPADNEIDPAETLRYARLMDDVDMVIPFVYNKHIRPHLRNMLSYIFTLIVNFTFGSSFNYTNGTVLHRRSIIKDLDCRSFGFFFQTDILIRLAKRGYLFAEVPYRLGVRRVGRSKAISLSSFLNVARDYFALVNKVYFRKEERFKRHKFTKDSVSGTRRGI